MATKKKANIVRLADRFALVDTLAKLQLLADRAVERLTATKEEVRKYAVEHYVDGATSIEILGYICGVPTLVKFPEPARPKTLPEEQGDELTKLIGAVAAEKFLKKETVVQYKVDHAELQAFIEANPSLSETVEKFLPEKAATPSVQAPKIDDNILAAIEKEERKQAKKAAQGTVQQVAQ